MSIVRAFFQVSVLLAVTGVYQPSFAEILDEDVKKIGGSDFTISIKVNVPKSISDTIGDIISFTDPDTMKGLHISIDSRAGMCANQTNFRNLFFGISGGDKSPQSWTDEGRPGNAVFINSMAVYNGSLYVGTLEPGEKGGRVYKYISTGSWKDVELPAISNSVKSLAEFNGKLCAATGVVGWGSSLPNEEMKISNIKGGKVYCYDSKDDSWEDLGTADEVRLLGGQNHEFNIASFHSLTVFNQELYGASGYGNGVYKYLGSKKWEYLGSPYYAELAHPIVRVQSMMPFNERLYASLNDSGGVAFHWRGTNWRNIGLHTLQNYSLAAYRGKLHVGTFDNGDVAYYGKDEKWKWFGRVENEDEIMAMAVYNGKFYAGTLPHGYVVRWDDDSGWTRIAELDDSPGKIGTRAKGYIDGILKRVWTMAVYKGRLFAGTLPSGKVKSMLVGNAVSHDYSFPDGWNHIAAVRKDRKLLLYLNGALAAENETEEFIDFSSDMEFLVGKGENKGFSGKIKDLTLSLKALSEDEVKALAH